MTVVELRTPRLALAALCGDWSIGVAHESEFEALFLDVYDGLVRSLTAVTGDSELAADCVQDAFIKAHARWSRIRRYDNPVTWIRRVAINRSRDILRSELRRRQREDRVNAVEPQHPDSAEIVTAGMNVVELLEQLSPRRREVAALFYVDDLSVDEVAASLRLSPGAVKFHLNRARLQLSELLEDRHDQEIDL